MAFLQYTAPQWKPPAYTGESDYGKGSGYLGTMGMSPEYNDQLFANIQGNINKNKAASRQNVLDNTSRFGQGGGQEQALLGVNQQAADQSVTARSQAEMEGARMHREDRGQEANRAFVGEQNLQNRLLQQMMQERLASQEDYQFSRNRQDAMEAEDRKMMMNLFGMGSNMGMGG